MPSTDLPFEGSASTPPSMTREVLYLIAARPRTILLGMLAAAVLGAILAFVLPPTYTANATFIPPANSSSTASMMMSQLNALTGMGSISGGTKDPGAIYTGILSSRSVADDIIAEFDLQRVYKRKKLSGAEQALAGHMRVMENKDGMISVSVVDTNAKRAADIDNALLKALMKQNDRLALTEASQRRAFFEQQLVKEKDTLADAEVALTQTEEKTGMIHPTAQAQVAIQAIAQTRAEIANTEIQLAALGQSETPDNPEVVRLNTQLSSLKTQLSHMEGPSGTGDVVMPSAAKTPELEQEYIRKERDVKFHEALMDLLLREYQSAKLDEARDAPMIQIVDAAVVPDTKSGPPRKMIVVGFALVGFLLTTAVLFMRQRARNLLFATPRLEPPLWDWMVRRTAGVRSRVRGEREAAGRTV